MPGLTDMPGEVLSLIISFAIPETVGLTARHELEWDRTRAPSGEDYYIEYVNVHEDLSYAVASGFSQYKKYLDPMRHPDDYAEIGTLRDRGIGLQWSPPWIPNLTLITRKIATTAKPIISAATALTVSERVVDKRGEACMSVTHGETPISRLELLPTWINSNTKTVIIKQIQQPALFKRVAMTSFPNLETVVCNLYSHDITRALRSRSKHFADFTSQDYEAIDRMEAGTIRIPAEDWSQEPDWCIDTIVAHFKQSLAEVQQATELKAEA